MEVIAPTAPLQPPLQTLPQAHRAAEATAPNRYDMYAGIHQGLRAMMTDTLVRVGRTDPADDADVAGMIETVGLLVRLCDNHVHDENTFIHPALEWARPGSSHRIAAEHVEHRRELDDLDAAATAIGLLASGRAAPIARLYRHLALFVADNFEHMAYEEAEHNQALWQAYGDAELATIEQAIVSSIEPSLMAQYLHWIVPALAHPQRLAMLADMRDNAPPPVFEAVLQLARERLSAPDWCKLEAALVQRH